LAEQVRPHHVAPSHVETARRDSTADGFDEIANEIANWGSVSLSGGGVTQTPPIVTPPEIVMSPTAHTAQRPTREGARRFLALRIVARFIELYGLAIGIFAFICGWLPIRTVAIKIRPTGVEWIIAVMNCIGIWLSGGIVVVIFLFFANLIRLGLQIEQNTFDGQESLNRLPGQLERLVSKVKTP